MAVIAKSLMPISTTSLIVIAASFVAARIAETVYWRNKIFYIS
jgi:hypothetical protein